MRKLLILLLVLMLTACGARTEAPSPTEPETSGAEGPAEEIAYQVEILRTGGTKQAEDGTVLLTYETHLPVLRAFREDGTEILPDGNNGQELTETETRALAVAETFNEQFAEWSADEGFSELAETAEKELSWYREEGFDWHGYTWELSCSVYRTEQMISVSGLYYNYTGGAHPNTCQLSWNFDLAEGAFFGPELLAEGEELCTAVAEEIIRQARTPDSNGYIPAEGYWEEYETLIADWSSYAVYFDEVGMTVVFSPYELAPYAAGPQEFYFTYDWLKPHLGARGQALLGLNPEI